jgi:hypothetical protein
VKIVGDGAFAKIQPALALNHGIPANSAARPMFGVTSILNRITRNLIADFFEHDLIIFT